MGDFLPRPRAAVSLVLLLLLPLPLPLLSSSSPPKPVAAVRSSVGAVRRQYDSIFSFGDSYTDTGNNPVAFAWYDVDDPVMRPPYGSTFFGRPTGRCCDGRLVIDFIAERLGLPLVPPFLAHGHGDGSFRRGANFAVGSATAVDASVIRDEEPPDAVFPLNVSLGVQLQWFETLLKPSLCATPKECHELLGRSLIFVGELGINDYSFLLDFGKSVQQVRSLVPDVVSTISMAVERLIKHGAISVVVSGMLPAGCMPSILNLFPGADDDDPAGCLKEMNELSAHHNTLLQESLDKIQARHPDVEVAYADLFSAVTAMVESPGKYGFDEDVLVGCCGGPGKYHYNATILCGDPGADTCEDPSARLFWDGTHLTEAANRYIADEWLSSIISPSPARATSQ